MTIQKDVPQAKDVMTTRVHTITPDMTLEEAIEFLLQHSISNAPVTNESNSREELVGFFSEGDGLEHLSGQMFFGNGEKDVPVGSIMKRHPVCVEPNADLFSLASILVSHRYRHLPVVEERWLVGIISRRDVLKALLEYHRKSQRTRDEERAQPDLSKLINLRFLLRGK